MSTFCDRIREQAGIKNRFYVELQGTSGGLTLWLKKEVDVRIVMETQNLIDCEIRLKH